MRSFDTWLRYRDNDNHYLHGCIQFMVKDGNTSAPIYDQDGVELDNPQITDEYGRTEHQVFIEEDVTAYFYKYIGTGSLEQEQADGIDTNDPSKWALQYTCENQSEYNLHLTSDAAMCVPSIAALRGLDVETVPLIGNAKVITLLGYNSVGDKEPINYVWVSGSTAQDNGGSTIACDDVITGRWIMVQPTEHCDTRHFGAFPQNSYNCPDQSYMIGQCCVYCMLHGLRPFFNGSMDYRWFKYSNMNVICDGYDVTPDTRFYDAGNNTFQGDWNGDPRFTLGNTNVVGAKNVKTSWNAKSYTGYKNVIIDQQATQKNWQDAHIDIQISPLYGYNFTHCTFEPNGNIGSDNVNGVNNTFNNCILNEKMFILDGDYSVSLAGLCTNCQIDPDDFRNAMWLYKEIRCTMDPQPFFDYRDFPNVGKPYNNYAANVITSDTIWVSNLKNANANKVTLSKLDNQTAIIFENCTGWYAIPASIPNVIIKDSSVKLNPGANQTIQVTNSSIEIGVMPNEGTVNLSLRDSTLSGSSGYFNMFASYSSIISTAVSAKNTLLKDSQINAEYRLKPEPGTARTVSWMSQTATVSHFIHGYIDNNIFNGKLVIDGAAVYPEYGTNQVLAEGLVIQNNRSNLGSLDAWQITRTVGCMNSDQLNSYTYVNNTGGFECKTSLTHVPIIPGGTLITPSYNGQLTETLGQLIESVRWAQDIGTGGTVSYADNMSCYFTKMRMFVIGLYDTKVDIEITVDDNPAPGGQRSGSDPIYVGPNCTYVAEGGTVYNYMTANYGPSKVQATLSTYSKYQDGTIDHQHTFIVADLAKDPSSITEEWQIRNFILGKGPGWFSGTSVNINLSFRQMDRRG